MLFPLFRRGEAAAAVLSGQSGKASWGIYRMCERARTSRRRVQRRLLAHKTSNIRATAVLIQVGPSGAYTHWQ